MIGWGEMLSFYPESKMPGQVSLRFPSRNLWPILCCSWSKGRESDSRKNIGFKTNSLKTEKHIFLEIIGIPLSMSHQDCQRRVSKIEYLFVPWFANTPRCLHLPCFRFPQPSSSPFVVSRLSLSAAFDVCPLQPKATTSSLHSSPCPPSLVPQAAFWQQGMSCFPLNRTPCSLYLCLF